MLKQRRNESNAADCEYRKTCNEVRREARRDKERWLTERCRDIQKTANEKRSRKTFKLIRDINGKWQPKQRGIKSKEGEMLQEEGQIRERWTEYCQELYMDTGNTMEVVEELQRMAPRQEETQDSLLKEEVKKALQMLKHHKSPGTDGIVAEALQAGDDRLDEELYGIMERVWSEEVIPTEWAKSVIVTIPKKGDL